VLFVKTLQRRLIRGQEQAAPSLFAAKRACHIIILVMVLRVLPGFFLSVNFLLGVFALFATGITLPDGFTTTLARFGLLG
jgi:hypothetical protein